MDPSPTLYFTWLPEDVSQRHHDLREVTNGVHSIVAAGTYWHMLLHDLPLACGLPTNAPMVMPSALSIFCAFCAWRCVSRPTDPRHEAMSWRMLGIEQWLGRERECPCPEDVGYPAAAFTERGAAMCCPDLHGKSMPGQRDGPVIPFGRVCA
jgi:hypothetical protein